jgi:hypothetical protein
MTRWKMNDFRLALWHFVGQINDFRLGCLIVWDQRTKNEATCVTSKSTDLWTSIKKELGKDN